MLHALMKTLVDAYNFSREGSLLKEAKDMMNPNMIEKIEELRKLVEKHFMWEGQLKHSCLKLLVYFITQKSDINTKPGDV